MNIPANGFEATAEKMRALAPNNAFYGHPSDTDISQAEVELSCKFPISYKAFLLEFGTSNWPSYIFGLGSGVLPGQNVVQVTKTERALVEPNLPLTLIPVSPDGWGNYYCLDTARLQNEECPIAFWNHELGKHQVVQTTHDSFAHWLSDLIDEEQD